MKKPNHNRLPSLTPGTVLVLHTRRHQGKRVVFLKDLPSGLLLFTGPFVLNRVPLSRASPKSVTATATKVDVSGLRIPETLTDTSFKRRRQRKPESEGEEGLEMGVKRLRIAEQWKRDQRAVDSQVLNCIRKVPWVRRFLSSEPYQRGLLKSWINWMISLSLLVMFHRDAVNMDLLVFDSMM
ncbi:60S ribosomal protein L6-like [Clupea harengus]|uniref:60S ribosomal protein L6-like n=1 Tax=Clupea harengus TaxID=7950 RepID=A0A8M1KFS3_CLUHA|nr:60S ribosomal protein L6-like [Clupea harengus]